MNADEYDLKVDEQTQELLRLNHQLTYFIITAVAASLGFTASTSLGRDFIDFKRWVIVVPVAGAALSGLLAVAAALSALTYDISSFRKHVQYRYARTVWTALAPIEQAAWETLVRRAAWLRKWSFRMLILSVALQLFFLIYSLVARTEPPCITTEKILLKSWRLRAHS
ncbi:MAG: hypothetical protein JNL62_04035 [Bryobacterales bacterium]|nr:hypothetical protein [Bryobacterales bacterium]